MLEQLLQRLRITGATILKYNSFGIIYTTQSGKYTLIKITYNEDKYVSREIITGFESFYISTHFIQLDFSGRENSSGLYIKESKRNFAAKYKKIYTYSNSDDILYDDNIDNYEALVYTTIRDSVIVFTYHGKAVDITKYVKKHRKENDKIIIEKLSEHEYVIGLCKAKHIWNCNGYIYEKPDYFMRLNTDTLCISHNSISNLVNNKNSIELE